MASATTFVTCKGCGRELFNRNFSLASITQWKSIDSKQSVDSSRYRLYYGKLCIHHVTCTLHLQKYIYPRKTSSNLKLVIFLTLLKRFIKNTSEINNNVRGNARFTHGSIILARLVRIKTFSAHDMANFYEIILFINRDFTLSPIFVT